MALLIPLLTDPRRAFCCLWFQDIELLRLELSGVKDALERQALLLNKTASAIRAEEDARAAAEREAQRTIVAELASNEDKRAESESQERQYLADSIEELRVRCFFTFSVTLSLVLTKRSFSQATVTASQAAG